jgi:hypothetical protein
MTIGGTLSDAWLLYRTLFRRSIVVALLVYAVIFTASALAIRSHFILSLVSFALSVAGPMLVQGALILLVQDIHVGNRPDHVTGLFRRVKPRLVTLVLASLVYGFLVVLGFLLLIVPGLWAASRLSMLAPVIVLEGERLGAALDRSAEIVKGNTGKVLVVVLISGALEVGAATGVPYAVGLSPSGAAGLLVSGVITVVLAPFIAHLLSAMYYRLTEPEKPLIDPRLREGKLWDGLEHA